VDRRLTLEGCDAEVMIPGLNRSSEPWRIESRKEKRSETSIKIWSLYVLIVINFINQHKH
jgi:hypothetical protein